MNTLELECNIKCDRNMRPFICGVFAKDELPLKLPVIPGGFIANTQGKDEKGEHWIAIYVDASNTGYFFDSFGYRPAFYNQHFVNFFERNNLVVQFNDKQLQSFNSNVCGFYCIFILSHLCRNIKFNDVIQLFHCNDNLCNDEFVFEFVVHAFDHCIQNNDEVT